MSKKRVTITDGVMGKIHEQHIEMRPKLYFMFGSFILFIGLIFSIISSVFMVSVIRFSLRSHGPMGQFRLEQMLSAFPWWALVLAIFGLISGIYILRTYDISYKRNFPMLIIGLISAVIIAGWTIDYLNLDDVWFRQGPMNGIMRQYMRDNGIQPGTGRNRYRQNSP